MEITGRYTFEGPAEKVWITLLDPELVGACVPGCRELRPIGDDRYEAVLSVAVSAITGTFTGTIAIEDKRPHSSYKLAVEGSGSPGFVRGHATIALTENGPQTILDVAGDAQVGGAVARVGQRLLAGVAKMMMDRFFVCLQQKV